MKKGFTLIELLAVIVILAIIALISSPIIIGLIDDARKEAVKDSAYGILKAGEIFYARYLLNEPNEEITFTYTDGVESSSVPGKKLEYNGTKPTSGEVKVNNEGQVAIAIHNGTYYTEKGYEDTEVTLSDKTDAECKIPFECGQDFTDSRDSNVYKTVKIGDQCWMAENLRYTENGCTSKTWDEAFPHDACLSHTPSWGEEILYQWGAAMNGSTTEGVQGLCPSGWYIPTDEEWTTLETFVGTTPGTKLKAETPIWNGTNNYGFNGKAAGYRLSDSSHFDVGLSGDWWSSSISGINAFGRNLFSDDPEVLHYVSSVFYGLSVRCLLGQ